MAEGEREESWVGGQSDEIRWLYEVAYRALSFARGYVAETGPSDPRARACLDEVRDCRLRVRALRHVHHDELVVRASEGPGLRASEARESASAAAAKPRAV